MSVEELGRLLEMGLSPSQAGQVTRGERTAAEAVQDCFVTTASLRWFGVPISNWPPFDVLWDTNPAVYYRSMDHGTAAQFSAAYPDILIAEACPAEIVAALPASRRRTEEPWEGEYKSNTAKVVAAWEAGIAITPPLLIAWGNGVTFAGGWHRFHVAMRKGVPKVKVLVRDSETAAIRLAVPSLVAP